MTIQHRAMLSQMEHILDGALSVLVKAEEQLKLHNALPHDLADTVLVMRDDLAGLLARICDGSRAAQLRPMDLQLRALASDEDRTLLRDYEARASRIIDGLMIER